MSQGLSIVVLLTLPAAAGGEHEQKWPHPPLACWVARCKSRANSPSAASSPSSSLPLPRPDRHVPVTQCLVLGTRSSLVSQGSRPSGLPPEPGPAGKERAARVSPGLERRKAVRPLAGSSFSGVALKSQPFTSGYYDDMFLKIVPLKPLETAKG